MTAQLPPKPSSHPIIGHAIQFARGPFDFVENAVTECGDAYRMDLPGADDVYVLCHPDYFQQVLVTDVDSFAKTADFQQAFGNGLLSTDGQQWRTQRDILQPLFYRNHVKGFTEQMGACVQNRLATWSPNETRDIEAEMQDLTFEILFATLFGQEVAPDEGTELREAADGLNEWFAPTSWMLPHWVPTPARRRFKRAKTRLRQEIRTILAADRNQQPTDGQDLLSQLLHAQNGDADFTMDDIEDQLVTMVFAGYETTATALAFAWYALATHPQIRQRFHTELDTVIGDDPLSYDHLSQLDVTERIIKETLRLFPPIHTIPRQSTVETQFNGFRVPAGKEIHLSLIQVHRDERYYEHPLDFQPDRWTDQFEAELHEFAYRPFGGGRRICIGREFALLEAKIVLATIGQQYQFEWGKGETPELEPQITTKTKNGIPMRMHAR